MDFFATKTRGEREDEEAERLVRPQPKIKPPRRDRRREEVQSERDPDVEGDSDLKGDPDLSLNYKTIGGSLGLIRRVVAGFVEAKTSPKLQQHKKEKKQQKRQQTLSQRPKPAQSGPKKYVSVFDSDEKKIVSVPEGTAKNNPSRYKPVKPGEKGEQEAPTEKPEAKEPEAPSAKPGGESDAKEEAQAKVVVDKFMKDHEGDSSIDAALAEYAKGLPHAKVDEQGDVFLLDEKTNKHVPIGDLSKVQQKAFIENFEKAKIKAPVGKPAEGEAPVERPAEAPVESPVPAGGARGAPGQATRKEKGIPLPKRKEPTRQQKIEALRSLMQAFPPGVAGKYFSMHPEDVKALIAQYSSFKALPLKTPEAVDAEVKAASKGFTLDPAKVKPPKTGQTWNGVEKPFEELSSTEQSETMQKHRIAVVSSNLAAMSRVSEAMEQSGASPYLASALAGFSLSSHHLPPEEKDRKAKEVARSLFVAAGTVLGEDEEGDPRFGAVPPKVERPKSSKAKLVKALKDFADPHTQMLAVAHLQGQDYQEAHKRFLDPKSPEHISEHDSPKAIYVKLQKASELLRKAGKEYPKEARAALDDPASIFRVRVQGALQELAPKKAEFVTKAFAHAEAKGYDKALEKYEGAKKEHAKAFRDYEEEYKRWGQDREKFEKATSAGDPYRQKPPEFKTPEPEPPLPPAPPIKPPGYDEIHKPSKKEQAKTQEELDKIRASKVASAYSSYHSQKEQMVNPMSSKAALRRAVRTAVYHGVEPYPKGHEGFAPYPDWQQAHQRDLGDSDFGVILAAAKTWLTSPILAKESEGMVPDARFRAALDLAIREASEGKYSGAITANLYNQLLAKLAKQPAEGTLLTIRKEAGFGYAVGTIWVLFTPARKPVPFNIDTINAINRTWIETEGDDGQAHEVNLSVKDTRSGGFLTYPQEKQGLRIETLVQVAVPESDIEKALEALKGVGRKFGFKVELKNSSYKPSVRKLSFNQTEGNAMTTKFAKEEANSILGRLDKLASTIQENHASWGMPFDTAKSIVNDLDKTADEIEKAAFGEESLLNRKVEILKAAKVIQQDAGEGYMATFNAPTAPHQTDSDEPYMGLFKDDQTTGVHDGKSTAGRPLAP